MRASVAARPVRFDRVDRVKSSTGALPAPGDDKLWILGDALTFLVDGRVHCVPVGFITDGATTSRIGRYLTGHWSAGLTRWPTVAHDWLYCHPSAARSYADAALRALLHSEGARWWTREVLFFSARLRGRRAFLRKTRVGPMIYEGVPMADLPDDAPTLEVAATRGRYLWSTPAEDPRRDTVRFEATGRNYTDLRQAATDMLAALLGEATVEGRVEMNLEIEPDMTELGSEAPVAWRAEVTAVIPRAAAG